MILTLTGGTNYYNDSTNITVSSSTTSLTDYTEIVELVDVRNYTRGVYQESYITTSSSNCVLNLIYTSQTYYNQTTISGFGVPDLWIQLSPEEIARREEQERKREEAAREAEKKAEILLLQNLDREQQEEYRLHKHFHIKVGDRKYRISKGWSHNIKLVENDKIVESLCAYPIGSLPPQDNMLAQKMMLECNEEEFRRIANISRY